MVKQPPVHSEMLTDAARQVLRPMGLVQKGRSRIWLDDHCWWQCVVEFQPSSWSRGSYLNVGCNWLWSVQDHLSFDEGNRVEPFSKFTDEIQFKAAARALAERAASEVARYRQLFPNVKSVSDYYLRHKPVGFWTNFHAGVACALAGRPNQARRFLREVLELRGDDNDWVLEAQTDAERLNLILDDTGIFRNVVAERVLRTRDLQKLPPLSTVDFDR